MSFDYQAELKKLADAVFAVLEDGAESTLEETTERCDAPQARDPVFGETNVHGALAFLLREGRAECRRGKKNGKKTLFWRRRLVGDARL